MKDRKINGTTVSYFSVFAKPLNVVAAYARNEELVLEFESSDYELAFPIYQAEMTNNLREGVEMQKRLRKAAVTLSDMLHFADPSHVVFDVILKNFTREEIDIVIDGA